MKGKISSVSSSEKSMASSTTTTTTTSTEEDSERRYSNCYFPDCRKDANCNCEICLDSLNVTLDLMPLSVQKSSLSKLSYASSNFFKPTVESTPTSFDPAVVTTPASVSRPISRMISPPKKKKVVQKSNLSENEKEPRKKNERRSRICVVLKLILVLVCLELGFGWVAKGILKPEFTEEIVRDSVERSQSFIDLGAKLRFSEDELKVFAKNGNFSSCRDSNSKWKINQDGPMLNSKCVNV